ncbi:MAG: hypothetical protein M5R36_17295 [Deltaproteobacteria bacterium]|nr:hypothetical protein [Deltaproteobacteria bacterium]
MSLSFREKVARLLEHVRTFEQADGRAPTAEDVAEAAGWSMEEVHFILHRMVDHGVLAMIPSAYDERYAVEDEDAALTIKTPEEEPTFREADADRAARTEESHSNIGKRFQSGFVDEDKQKLFADMQSRLAGGGEKKPNPSTALRPRQGARRDAGKGRYVRQTLRGAFRQERKKPNPLDMIGKKKKDNE